VFDVSLCVSLGLRGMSLRLHRYLDTWGSTVTEVRSDGLCDCHAPEHPATLAHVGYSIVAATLAEPLRRALSTHIDEHGCAERGGFWGCDEAMRLFRLLPASEQILIG
jgi:hypothetical protein